MPVIIHEFEIVTESPAQAQTPEQPAQAGQEQAVTLRPEEIERIVRHYQERLARVWAD